MQKAEDHFSEVIDITLYKYNSIDLKLWGVIMRDFKTRSTGDKSMLVSKDRMLEYLQVGFRDDVNRFSAVSDVNIHKEATSIYFIWQIFQTMPQLRYIRVNLNMNSSYNRIVNVDQVKTIKYDNNFTNEKDFFLYLTNSKSLFSFLIFFVVLSEIRSSS